MARYTMDDGAIVDTKKARTCWEEDTTWDGNNRISVVTGSQWDHQTLYCSNKGRYYVEYTSQWEGRRPRAEFIPAKDAARWLIANDHDLPDDLSSLFDDIIE